MRLSAGSIASIAFGIVLILLAILGMTGMLIKIATAVGAALSSPIAAEIGASILGAIFAFCAGGLFTCALDSALEGKEEDEAGFVLLGMLVLTLTVVLIYVPPAKPSVSSLGELACICALVNGVAVTVYGIAREVALRRRRKVRDC